MHETDSEKMKVVEAIAQNVLKGGAWKSLRLDPWNMTTIELIERFQITQNEIDCQTTKALLKSFNCPAQTSSQ